MHADERGCNCSAKLTMYRFLCIGMSIVMITATYNYWQNQQTIAELRSVIDDTSKQVEEMTEQLVEMRRRVENPLSAE